MLKKILIGVIILFIAVAALMVYGTYTVVDETLKSKEPQLRQYMQLDEAAQNQYVMEHAVEIFNEMMKQDVKPEDKATVERFEAAQQYPEVQQALLKFGRSFFAQAIVHSDALVKDLSADVKAKYQTEADMFKQNFETYADVVNSVTEKLKAAK